MAKDYYQILGISKGAGEEEIRKAFKKLARKYHPDVNPGDKKAEERFKEISEANEVLSNPEKRKKYDAFGTADFEGFPGGGAGGWRTYTYNPFEGGGGKYGAGIDLDDLGDIFGDLFGGLGGVGGAARRRRGFTADFGTANRTRKGKDLYFSLDLDFTDAAKGCEKTIRLGSGVSFKVKIPAGITDGQKIRLAGKGEPGVAGGEAGDLYIEPRIIAHPWFRRSGNDIEVDLPLNLSEALSGGKVKAPTIDGMVEVKIPAGAQSGQKMRLKGKGALDRKTGSRGDQYLVLQVHLPEGLDQRSKEELLKAVKGKEADPRKKLWG
ncbi:MAG: DnaJ domain-containing protein [Deltaproteobacteria bacterium]|nr:DnaJ domain-containing protein [Deltaproteobacteria bacterium]